ncbi:hypothetical protein FLW53_09085 [Microbispora sp. SCL1-1]|uniref:hypothetical protein n=1 Tax=unclassified Microbispora TaxID=2614687 RepID=UPI00115BA9C6|nr:MULTISPECIES: hypothetical protein [unclassified Microbispora]NJP24351.1 hypothetical protein [Microbispora sp. CL1-1]TQS15137.1 hypothetical protein FLW53_09085 [Microbispora sp. SCL1-1]
MGYPGDQQPPPPHHPPDPRRRDLPPYSGGDDAPLAGRRDAPPYGGGQPPYQREPSPYAREQSPYERERSPYAREQAPYQGHPQQGHPQQAYQQQGYQQQPEQPPYAGAYEQEGPQRAEELASGPYAAPTGPYASSTDPYASPSGAYAASSGGQAGGADTDARRQRAASRMPPPPEPVWDPDAKGPWWRRPWALGLALLLMIGALFTGLWYAARNEKPPVAAPTPTVRPTKPLVSEGPPGKFGYTASRTTDKTPLSLRELFAKGKFVKNKRSYVRTAYRKEKKCADGVTGDKITKALKAGACTQLLRASFADSKGVVIGTVGVANLKTSATAKKVASAGGGGERKDYLKPLPGKDEATKHLGTGEAYAGGWTHGHYAVLLWFQFKDGHKPAKNELKRLYQAAVDVTDATVFPALDTRSLNGGPS